MSSLGRAPRSKRRLDGPQREDQATGRIEERQGAKRWYHVTGRPSLASLASATTPLDPAKPLGGEVNIYDGIAGYGRTRWAIGREVEQGS